MKFHEITFHLKFHSWGSSMGNGNVTDVTVTCNRRNGHVPEVTVSVRGEVLVGTEWEDVGPRLLCSAHTCIIGIVCLRCFQGVRRAGRGCRRHSGTASMGVTARHIEIDESRFHEPQIGRDFCSSIRACWYRVPTGRTLPKPGKSRT